MPDFDTSELDRLAADFTVAAAKIVPALLPTTNKTGVQMKAILKKDSTGHSHLPGLPSKAEYDVKSAATSVTLEVGFRKEGQGNLANIAAYGSVNNAPVLDITRGLTEELPKFMRFIGEAAAKALD